jgi:hypothetical protein
VSTLQRIRIEETEQKTAMPKGKLESHAYADWPEVPGYCEECGYPERHPIHVTVSSASGH